MLRRSLFVILALAFAACAGAPRRSLLPSDVSPELAELDASQPLERAGRPVRALTAGREDLDRLLFEAARVEATFVVCEVLADGLRNELVGAAGELSIPLAGMTFRDAAREVGARRSELPAARGEAIAATIARLGKARAALATVPNRAPSLHGELVAWREAANGRLQGEERELLPDVLDALNAAEFTLRDAGTRAARLDAELERVVGVLAPGDGS